MKEIDAKLFSAARAGDAPACLDLIEHGANAHVVDDVGRSVLFWPAWLGRANVCQLLLKQGVNVSAVDKIGCSALHFAAEEGCIDICLTLLENNADFEIKNQQGDTPLDLAIECKKFDCASVIRSWISSQAARAALQEITAAVPHSP